MNKNIERKILKRKLLYILLFVLIVIGLLLLVSCGIMLLWNYLVALAFTVPKISFLQSFVITIVLSIVFSIFGKK